MAKKIKQVIEQIVDDVEGVVVRFLGHVRHDGQDYHPGDTAEIAPEHAAKLADLGVAEPVTAIEPAAPVDAAEHSAAAAADAAESSK